MSADLLLVLMRDLNAALKREGIGEDQAVWESHYSTGGETIRLRLDGSHHWLDVGRRGDCFVRSPGTSRSRRWKLHTTALDRLLRETVRLVRDRELRAWESARMAELADVVARVPGVRRNSYFGGEFSAPGQFRLRVHHDHLSLEVRGLSLWEDIPIDADAFDAEVESVVAAMVAIAEEYVAAQRAARDKLHALAEPRPKTWPNPMA